MTVKNQPATPLPWEVLIRDGANGIAGRIDPVVGGCIPRGLDAIYVAHTANAYPKLVEALRITPQRAWDPSAYIGYSDEQIALIKKGFFSGLDRAFEVSMAVLREVGEES